MPILDADRCLQADTVTDSRFQADIRDADIVLTTPEKWHSTTKSWRNEYGNGNVGIALEPLPRISQQPPLLLLSPRRVACAGQTMPVKEQPSNNIQYSVPVFIGR